MKNDGQIDRIKLMLSKNELMKLFYISKKTNAQWIRFNKKYKFEIKEFFVDFLK